MSKSGMSVEGQIRPWCSTGVDDGLSPDSYRSAQTLVTAEVWPDAHGGLTLSHWAVR